MVFTPFTAVFAAIVFLVRFRGRATFRLGLAAADRAVLFRGRLRVVFLPVVFRARFFRVGFTNKISFIFSTPLSPGLLPVDFPIF